MSSAERTTEKEREESGGGGGGGFFGSLFRGKEANAADEPTKMKKEQLENLQEIAKNDDFLNELDSVIAEAEEAIAIAKKVEEAPPKNKGGFYSSLGFVSGKEATKEAETLIANAEERTSKAASSSNILWGISFGGVIL